MYIIFYGAFVAANVNTIQYNAIPLKQKITFIIIYQMLMIFVAFCHCNTARSKHFKTLKKNLKNSVRYALQGTANWRGDKGVTEMYSEQFEYSLK